MAEPILKWAGGKRPLLSEIKGRFPQQWDAYHEPFIGGAAVFLDLEPTAGSINDLNTKLVTLYEIVRDYPERLIEENRTHFYKNEGSSDNEYYDEETEEYYYARRKEFRELHNQDSLTTEEKIRAASLFIFLNKTGYNGLYRENQSGEFNVPVGKHHDPDFVREDQIRSVSAVFSAVDIYNEDFEYVSNAVSSGDLVYFDPPYKPVSKTADFTQYQAEGFDRDDQRRLRDLAVELDSRGVSVVLSNSPPVRELYESADGFEVEFVEAPRFINRDASGRGDVAEVIITNVSRSQRRQQTLENF
ncbi:DNA adenine methylase [Halobaculum rubrum]|uniref:DNA adenine methylase n=1 Tax=Halobaculum rubrum TaxID=2872158 RepID=UPI001CA3EDCD|nr:Dam family site-specific DNA-(adenine-N6)-methyltransferase [Halobaculum rubrum]QZY01198.1 Dam family site-specific DNA-(adenine-N6)-methyltransferase [Halobaculum rubrum]